MADVKWIKLTTNIFENRKIRQIECLPDGDAIIVIWVKLLCLAGNINDSGFVYFTKEIPYTEQMLATQFNRPLTTIQLALRTFEQFGMLEVIDNVLHISNWEKYQSVDRLSEIREYNRLAKQKSREKQKLLQDVNDKSMTSQRCQGTDIDIEEEIDKNKKKNKKINTFDESAVKEEFEKLWKLYPRKLGKDNALKSYIKARKNGVLYETVEQGIKGYCDYIKVTKTTKEYIKHGSTWFNNSCWNDDYTDSEVITDESIKRNVEENKFFGFVPNGLNI